MKKEKQNTAFLMTYGWAILAAIVAVGFIVYLGIFSHQNTKLNSSQSNSNETNVFQDNLSNLYTVNVTQGIPLDFQDDYSIVFQVQSENSPAMTIYHNGTLKVNDPALSGEILAKMQIAYNSYLDGYCQGREKET